MCCNDLSKTSLVWDFNLLTTEQHFQISSTARKSFINLTHFMQKCGKYLLRILLTLSIFLKAAVPFRVFTLVSAMPF